MTFVTSIIDTSTDTQDANRRRRLPKPPDQDDAEKDDSVEELLEQARTHIERSIAERKTTETLLERALGRKPRSLG